MSKLRPTTKPQGPRQADPLEAAATLLLDDMGKRDPMWQKRIQIAREQHGLSDCSLVEGWLAQWVIDAERHTIPPTGRAELRGDHQPIFSTQPCEYAGCQKPHKVRFVGDRFCPAPLDGRPSCVDQWRAAQVAPAAESRQRDVGQPEVRS